jgi:PAS domain S-box-containing protein
MSNLTNFLLTSVCVLGLLNAGLYLVKSFQKHDPSYIIPFISRIYVGLAALLVLMYSFDAIDRFYLNVGLTFVLTTDLILNVLYFASKKYKESIEYQNLMRNLENLEAKYSTVVENSLVGFYVIDEQSKFELVNKKFCEVTGYTKTELLRMKFTDILTGESVTTLLSNINEQFCGKSITAQYDISVVTKDGRIIPAENLGSVTCNGHRTITGNILPK